ncbi:MAG: zinc ribbon domain-containing protein [Myxococcota bacterium]
MSSCTPKHTTRYRALDVPVEPCPHCETPLHAAVKFCFECGAPVVPSFSLPVAPSPANDAPLERATAIFEPVPEDPNTNVFDAVPVEVSTQEADEMDDGPDEYDLDTGDFDVVEPGPHTSWRWSRDEVLVLDEVETEEVVEEIPVEMTDDDVVADPHGTVLALAPERPMPFWPAPPKGETVIAPAPTRPKTQPNRAVG